MQDVKEDSLSDESICVQFAGDWPARHSPIIEPYLPSASVLEPPRATDEVRLSLDFPPKYIILPTAYFGLASCTATRRDESPSASPYYSAGRYEQRTLKRHASLTDRPPFYPPGPNQRSAVAESTFERSQRMREARQLYRSPQSRRALGTPACYRGSSSLSSLRNRASPACTAQASSRSRSRGSAQGTMAPKSRQPTRQQVEKNRRDLWQSEPQLNKVEAHSKSKRSGRKEKQLTATTQRTSPADCSYWLSRDYMPAKYIDTSTKLARSRHGPLPIESFRPQKTTLWYRSDPDIALTTSESEQEKTELMPTAVQITTDLTYRRPDTSACFKHGSEVQPSGNGTYAQEDSNPLVPRRLASSPIQINRTYTKSQCMAYQQELNILREGVNLKSSTETAPKNSTEERFPTYGVPSSVKAASNASVDQDLGQPENLQKERTTEKSVVQPSLPMNNHGSEHLPQISTRQSELANTEEANRPSSIHVPQLAPISSSNNQITISCKACGKYVDIKERMELLNDIFHRFCFKCAVCREELSSTKAILCNNRWTCELHSEFKWLAHSDQFSKLLPV